MKLYSAEAEITILDNTQHDAMDRYYKFAGQMHDMGIAIEFKRMREIEYDMIEKFDIEIPQIKSIKTL